MLNKLTDGALKLVVSPKFNYAVAELTCLPADEWFSLSTEQKKAISMPELVQQMLDNKASLMTKKLLDIQKETNATSEEMEQAFQHFISFLEAQKLLLSKCKELSTTL